MWKSTAFSSVFHAQTQTRNNNKEMELQTARFFFLWICARIAEEMKIQKKIEKNCRDSLVHSKKSRAKYWDVKKRGRILFNAGGWLVGLGDVLKGFLLWMQNYWLFVLWILKCRKKIYESEIYLKFMSIFDLRNSLEVEFL